jgi:hypothetical protein
VQAAEEATCGLGIYPNTASDKLNPQETTTQDALEMGADGAGLSCPGSRVVADEKIKAARFKNPAAIETIGLELVLSNRSQSLTEE